jgi:hypothetical protein
MSLPNPNLWYKFEDNLLDSSGNGYTATNGQPSWGSLSYSDMLTVGRAVGPQIDGQDYAPFVQTPYTGWCGGNKHWTCNIWIKTHVAEYSNSAYAICEFGRYINANYFGIQYYKSTQRVYISTYNVGAYVTPYINKESEIMLTCRYNGDNSPNTTIDAFLNGNYTGTLTVGDNLTIYTNFRTIMGAYYGHDNYSCGCLIGDWRIYESALTNEQIGELYDEVILGLPSQDIFLRGVDLGNLTVG